MTASPEWQPPQEPRTDLGPIDGLEAADLGNMTEAMRVFDATSIEMNQQIVLIMQGKGGNNKQEAVGTLIDLQTQAATKFGMMAAEVFTLEESHDEAIATLATIYDHDEKRRIGAIEGAAPQAISDEKLDLEKCSRTDIITMLNTTLYKLKEDLKDAVKPKPSDDLTVIEYSRYASHFAEFYDEVVEDDFEKSLGCAPPNSVELHAVDHAMRRERVLGALGNLSMMVGASALTVLGMSLIDKRRK